ncbi:MAG: DUF4212 domain-containing protein [Gammaproteobacteria bacterium]|nr:DUF4212 domain-containing protein [Gammaproteobacteria bacterium]
MGGELQVTDKPEHPGEPSITPNHRDYWRANLRLVLRCLAVWFFVSYGCGILFVDVLNQFRIGGFPLGFWFAQQGSILVFMAVIAYYARAMTRLDRAFDVDEE